MSQVVSVLEMCFLCGETVSGSSDVRKVLSAGGFDKKFKDVILELGCGICQTGMCQ